MAKELTKEDIEAFDCALGEFVREWSATELLIDLIVFILRKPKDPLPHQLTAKARFIRRALPSKSFSQTEELLQLIDEIKLLAETRHAYVHGAALIDTPERSRLVVSMVTLLQPPGSKRSPIRVTAPEILKTAEHVREIGDQLLDFADALIREKRR